MKKRYLMLMIFSLFVTGQASRSQDVIADTAGIVVGAIRWDWSGGGMVGEAVEKTLGPRQWHHRVPFYGEIINDSTVSAGCMSQECVDREILYAKENGLDYFAFLLYEEGGDMDRPLRRYLSSGYNTQLNFAVIGARPADRIMKYFRHPSYQTVMDGRPLYYVYNPPEAGHIASLTEACAAEGIPEPYIVQLKGSTLPGVHAISRYWYGPHNFGGSKTGAPYSTLRAASEADWAQRKADGSHQVPLVSTGADGRPRLVNTPPWIDDPWFYEFYYEPPTPAELAGHLQQAVNFVADSPDNCESGAILMYSWNENDEGGWLTPTLDLENPGGINDSRLRAVKEVLHPLDTADPLAGDASLAALLVDKDTLEGFRPDSLDYRINLFAGITERPVVNAITANRYARTHKEWMGDTLVCRVTAEDGSDSRKYSFVFNRTYVPPEYIGWEFDHHGDTEGWTINWSGHLTIDATGDVLMARINGDYPGLLSPEQLGINTETYDRIRIRLKNMTSSNDWYFGFDLPNGTVKYVAMSPSVNDSEFKEYTINLGPVPEWTGIIDHIRFSMARLVSTGSVAIDYIRMQRTGEALSDDATLSSLKLDGTVITGFSPGIMKYDTIIPDWMYPYPSVEASPNHPGATIEIIQANLADSVARVRVISQSGLFENTYEVRLHPEAVLRGSFFREDFSEEELPGAWDSHSRGYEAAVQEGTMTLDVSKTSAEDAYTLQHLYLEDFDRNPYMTFWYASKDTLEISVTIIGQAGVASAAEVFTLPAAGEWSRFTFNLSALADEGWGYHLDSLILNIEPSSPDYQGNLRVNEIFIGDSPSGKIFSLAVDQADPLVLDLGPDTTLQAEGSLVLDAGNPGAAYEWNTGAVSRTIQVDSTGLYSVRVTGKHNCFVTDTVNIVVSMPEGIDQQAIDSGIKIYPNPASSSIFLSFADNSGHVPLEIYLIDVTGRVCQRQLVRPSGNQPVIEMKVCDQPPGTYMLMLRQPGQPAISVQVIILN